MNARMTFSLPVRLKRELDALAHKLSAKHGRTITNGELARRAIMKMYNLRTNRESCN